MHIKTSDKFVYRGIYMSIQAHRNYNDEAKELAFIVKNSLPLFRKFLDFPKDILVRIGTKRGSIRGSYSSKHKTVFLNISKFDYEEAMTTLAHELVHAEQYKQGRLKNKLTGRGYINLWNGEQIKNKGMTYNSYKKQPWEAEAFARQDGLAKKVTELLEEIYAEDR